MGKQKSFIKLGIAILLFFATAQLLTKTQAASYHWFDSFSDFSKISRSEQISLNSDYSLILTAQTPGTIHQTTKEEFHLGSISTLPNDAATPTNTDIPSLDITSWGNGELRIANQILWQYGTTSVSALAPNTIRGNAYTSRKLANGNVLVTSQENRVIEVDRNKNIVWQYGSSTGASGSGVNRLYWPYNADRNSLGNTIISDYANNRIIEIKTSDYNPLLPELGYTASSIVNTCTISGFISGEVLPDDKILLTIRGAQYIAIYDLNGCQLLWRYGNGSGTGINQLLSPHQPMLLANGNILVVDKNTPKVFELRKNDYNILLPNWGYSTDSILWEYGGTSGSGINQLSGLEYASETNDGNILISDRWNYKAYIINKSDYSKGAPQNGFTESSILWQYGNGTAGNTAGRVGGLLSARKNTDGTVLITDQGNNRVIEVGYPTNETATYTSTALSGGNSSTSKLFTTLEITTKPLPAGTSIEALFSVDSGTFTPLGIISNVGVATHLLEFPPSTMGKEIKYQLRLHTNSHDATPVITDVTIRYETFDIPAQWMVDTNSQFLMGNKNGTSLIDNGEKITLATNWTSQMSASTSLYASGTVVYNDKIYSFGGCALVNGVATYYNNTRVYDPFTNAWTELAPFTTGRCTPQVFLIGSKVYVLGGSNTAALTDVQEYDIPTNTWKTMSSFLNRGSYASYVTARGNIYILGGYTSVYFDDIQEFNPTAGPTGTWTVKSAKFPTKRGMMTAVTDNNIIYAMSGYTGSIALNNLYAYDPVTDTLTELAPLVNGRYYATSYLFNNTIYLAGGYGGGYKNDLQAYDILTNTWSTKSTMPVASYNSILSMADSDYLVMFGGYMGTGYNTSPLVYSIATDRWQQLEKSPSQKAYGFTIRPVLGKFYQVGGYSSSEGYSSSLYSFYGYIENGIWTSAEFDAEIPSEYKLFTNISWTTEIGSEPYIELEYQCDTAPYISLGTSGSTQLPPNTTCKSLRFRALFSRDSNPWSSSSLLSVTIKYLMYGNSGIVESSTISRAPTQRWDKITLSEDLPAQTTIQYSIIDATTNIPIVGYQQIRPIGNILSLQHIQQKQIKIQAQLITTNTAYSPKLSDWDISWNDSYSTISQTAPNQPSDVIPTPSPLDPLQTDLPLLASQLFITDQQGMPLVNAIVQISNREYITNEKGIITTTSQLTKGNKITIIYQGKSYETEVLGEESGELKAIVEIIPQTKRNITIFIFLLLLIIIMILIWVMRRYRQKEQTLPQRT